MSRRLPYQPQLDGLRAMAVGAVLIFHLYPPGFRGGYIGVDVFFVLSGFLITTLLVREHEREGRVSLKGFYLRRFRRLAPALLLVTAVVGLVWLAWPTAPDRDDTLLGIPAALSYTSGWLVAFGVSDLGRLRTTWSLSVEEHFYLAWPVIFIATMRYGARRLVAVTTAVFLAFSGWYMAGYFAGWGDRLYSAPDTRAKDILAGCVLGVVLVKSPGLLARSKPATGLAVGAAGLLALWVVAVDRTDGMYEVGWIIPIAASALLIACLYQQPSIWPAQFLSDRRLVWVGQRSYGIYLCHYPIIGLMDDWGGWPLRLTGGVIATGLFAAASYKYVERPILDRRRPVPGAVESTSMEKRP